MYACMQVEPFETSVVRYQYSRTSPKFSTFVTGTNFEISLYLFKSLKDNSKYEEQKILVKGIILNNP